MKIRHNVPPLGLRSEPITPGYQAEVDRSTSKAMVAYERAQRRLRAAEQRLEQARAAQDRAADKRAARAAKRELAVALELVELRREELRRVESLMKAAPASAEHRGVRGFRPVPKPGNAF